MSSLPASIKRIGSKATEKRWRHHFPHYKSMGLSVAMDTRVLIQSASKHYAAFPHPSDATHKILSRLANWLRDIKVQKCKIFVIQGQVTPKWVVWSSLKSNSSVILCLSWLPATVMMMIRSQMNELAWRHHFPIINLWEFRGARDLAFCLKGPLDSLLVWASSGGSGETARMRRLAWTFAARIGDKYQIRLTQPICKHHLLRVLV